MSPHHANGLISTRRSLAYEVIRSDDELLWTRLNSESRDEGYFEYMLMEDVGRPLSYGRGTDEKFTATVIGPDSTNTEPLIREALSMRHNQFSLSRTLSDFLNQTAQILVLYGPQTYEIDYLVEAGSSETRPVAFRLELLHGLSVGRLHGRPIQFVPRMVETQIHKNGLKYIELDPDRLVNFHLPHSIVHEVRRAVDFLATASRQQSSEFALIKRSMRELTGYDATVHNKATGELVLEATRPIGWAARGLYKEHVLEPYAIWRRLRFKRFKVGLRDSILEQLNSALASIGKELDFKAQVVLSGVPTVDDLDTAEADLLSGRRSLLDLEIFAV